ncbi:kinesin family member 4/21/27 [Schistosoma bovis]|uniref:Kinesin-like protein n=1 Tax=Schistosoma bovis TaxID=6184 RepID=A0A430QUQ4_SCHBO|nr:kinesin family member 4/21/27 [Schistosoma bovis]
MGTCISESVVEESAGIVPRIIKDLFERMPNYEYEYTVKVSFLEIYKEDIHDLLGEDVSASLQIREENQLVKIAAMDGENTEDALTAKLHLVDLAGSERIKKTHAEGDRLKEGLVTLGKAQFEALLNEISLSYRMIFCLKFKLVIMYLYYFRYADRARLIKNKPILNRADPKDAELAKLRVLVAQLQARLANGSSCFPLLSPCPKTIIKPLSTTTTINNNSTNSHFSSELVTNLMNKNKKLESEKLLLCAELDHIVEQMQELYKNRFDTDHLHDTVISELLKIESILNSLNQFVRDKFNEYPELISYIQELEDILTGLIKLYNESNKVSSW